MDGALALGESIATVQKWPTYSGVLVNFAELALMEPLLRAIQEEGYETPTPIQRDAIPHVLAGRDLLGCAQTGTGKTAAFALPILHSLAGDRVRPRPRHPRALVLTPTRELAIQVQETFTKIGLPLKILNIFPIKLCTLN